jgi:hypothetical protein
VGSAYLAAPVIIIRHPLLRETVDTQTMLGAITAYLMIGMSFAVAYRALGTLGAGPFFGSQGDGTFSQDLYCSFTTLTTTGYGNLVPAATRAEHRRPGDADRPAVPGDGGGQGGDHLATRPGPRAASHRQRSHLSRTQQVLRRQERLRRPAGKLVGCTVLCASMPKSPGTDDGRLLWTAAVSTR